MNLVAKTNQLPAIQSDLQDGLQKYLREINLIPSLSEEEEFLIAKSYLETQDLKAAEKLVTSHLKLVAKIALTFRNYGLPVNELISEGNLGLMHAVKKFKPDLGYRLSTYAMWWIKAAIQEYILKSWSLVKLGTTASQKKLFFSLKKIQNKLRNQKARDVNEGDYQEIAENLGVEVSDVAEMDKRMAFSDLSLNSPSSIDEGSNELIDFIPETRPSQEVIVLAKQESRNRHLLLQHALKILNERELFVIQERRLKEKQTTLDEISEKLLVSKERVRQIENRAFEKMQNFMKENIVPAILAQEG
ncbi:MAG: RNA polymerase factor sigma-32 [Rickettsiaceae bacterium]|nr:RNA polymerase factor sigma-32 [Rickettsiaceae bacterium]